MNLTLNNQEYSTSGKLDTFTQLHVARKLGPAMPVLEGMVDPDNLSKDKTLLTVLMLSKIGDSDVEYIMRRCLSVVTRKHIGGFAKIQTAEGNLMFDDISLHTLLELTVTVIEENLGDFFRTALGGLEAAAK